MGTLARTLLRTQAQPRRRNPPTALKKPVANQPVAVESDGTRYFAFDVSPPRSSRRHSRSRHHHRRSPSPSISASSPSYSRSRSRSPRRKHRPHRHRSHHQPKQPKHRSHRHTRNHYSRSSAPPVSRDLREKIERGKFIEFTELLGEITVAGGAGVLPRSSKRRVAPIASLQSWLQAWSTFAEVLSAIFPSCAPHLWRYQAFIVRSSQRFQTAAWLQYDMLFRRKIALDASLSWSGA